MKPGDLVIFPGVGPGPDDHGIGMVVEIYESSAEYLAASPRASELLVDVLWPDGDLIHGYLARDFEVISEGR